MLLDQYLEASAVSQTELARRVGVSPGMVWQWLNGRRRIAAENVLSIEEATGGAVTRYELRPDLYPLNQSSPPASRESA
jgi:DNA-binding transcriptional regulator YdaS (Cro superfamily)